ncbi:MAG TPA: GDYXXLXY domain-containing protein, partial [Blastocatellia bacterium]|nr:GDYXXLXY domain-containing protein [Blastocatellia bacterium]
MNKKALLFMLAVAVQVLILISMPLSKAYTRATGRSVILKVAPVDPYTILSGYYVTLNYDISRTDNFTKVETSTSNQPDKASGEGSL